MTDTAAAVLLWFTAMATSALALILAARANARSRKILRRLEFVARRNVARRRADEHLTQPNGAGR